MKIFAALPILLLSVVPAHADVPASPPAVAAPAPGPVVRMRFTPGVGSDYKLWLGLNGTMGAPGASEGIPVTGSLAGNARLTSGKPGADGAYPVRFKVSGLKYTMNGAPAMPPGLPSAFEVGGTVTADGVFTPDAKSRERLAGGGLMPGPAEFLEMMLRSIVSLPRKELAKGDTWSLMAPGPVASSGAAPLTVTSTVENVTVEDGVPVASVRRTLKGPLDLKMSSPIALTISGSVAGDGIVKVSDATGLPVDDTGSTRLKIKLSPGGDAGAKMEYTMDMEMKTHVVAIPAAKSS